MRERRGWERREMEGEGEVEETRMREMRLGLVAEIYTNDSLSGHTFFLVVIDCGNCVRAPTSRLKIISFTLHWTTSLSTFEETAVL